MDIFLDFAFFTAGRVQILRGWVIDCAEKKHPYWNNAPPPIHL